MAQEIYYKNVLRASDLTDLKKTESERTARKRIERFYQWLPGVLIVLGFLLCVILVLVRHEYMGPAFGVIFGIVGGVSGMLFGTQGFKKDDS